MPDPDYPSLDPEIAALLRRRTKEQAIKAVREKTGLRMKAARERIDAYESVDIPQEPIASRGQVVVWLAVFAVGVAIYFAASWLFAT